MDKENARSFSCPKIGMRNIKTATAAALCAFVYMFFNRSPAFACIGAIFGMGGIQPGGVVLCIVLFNTPVDSYISYSLNRIFDTGVGVLVALLVNSLFPGGFTFTWMAKIYADYIETAGERYAKDQADRQIRIMHRNQNQGKKGPWI